MARESLLLLLQVAKGRAIPSSEGKACTLSSAKLAHALCCVSRCVLLSRRLAKGNCGLSS